MSYPYYLISGIRTLSSVLWYKVTGYRLRTVAIEYPVSSIQ